MSALGHSGQRIDIYRKEDLVVVTLGAFPEPAYAPPDDQNRRNEVVSPVPSEPLSPERQESQGAGCCKVRRAIRRTAT
jgi:hypothetical protein